MWKLINNSKIIREYFNNVSLKDCVKEEYKSECNYKHDLGLKKEQHGTCHHYTIINIPKNVNDEIKVIINNNTSHTDFKYVVKIINYTFDINEYIYNLDFHDDDNKQTIIMYLDKDNVNDLFYIEGEHIGMDSIDKKSDYNFYIEEVRQNMNLINLDDDMWNKGEMLVLGDGSKSMPVHGGIFMKQNKNKKAYRKILSIFV